MPPTIDAELRALAAAIREIRARQQLSQERVGAKGGVGRKYVGQIERGEITPSFAALVGIANGLDVPLSELIRVYEERLRMPGGSATGPARAGR
ncbi:MAG: helix-turn-helix transcriptional regulator [Actinobacteria bacterium]|nr:helix-turn-helix transcriptional regulator [Actinomycetota bacterium]